MLSRMVNVLIMPEMLMLALFLSGMFFFFADPFLPNITHMGSIDFLVLNPCLLLSTSTLAHCHSADDTLIVLVNKNISWACEAWSLLVLSLNILLSLTPKAVTLHNSSIPSCSDQHARRYVVIRLSFNMSLTQCIVSRFCPRVMITRMTFFQINQSKCISIYISSCVQTEKKCFIMCGKKRILNSRSGMYI